MNTQMNLREKKRNLRSTKGVVVLFGLLLAAALAHAEYGDVVMNQLSEKHGARPVIFSHTFHRIRFRCKVCHGELGFKMRVGANQVLMSDIIDGKFCGMCHNDQIAWGTDKCDLCHSGLPGLKTRIIGGALTNGPGRW